MVGATLGEGLAGNPTRLVVLDAGTWSSAGDRHLLADVGGISLVERAVVSAGRAGFDEVVVVTADRRKRVERHVLSVSRRRGVAASVAPLDPSAGPLGFPRPAGGTGTCAGPFAVVPSDRLLSPSMFLRLRNTAVGPNEVVAAVDERRGRSHVTDEPHATEGPDARADRHATSLPLADGRVRAVGDPKQALGPIAIGAFVCGADAFEPVAVPFGGNRAVMGALDALAGDGLVRALPIGPDDWWFEVGSWCGRRRATRQLLEVAAKPRDGTVAVYLNGILARRLVTPALVALFPRIGPNQVSLMACCVGVIAGVALAIGAPVAAALSIALAAVLDRSDGEIARLTLRSSAYGGFLDAVLDRAADGALLTGAAIYLATDPRIGDVFGTAQVPVAIAVSGAALVGHLLVSYTTAKGALDLGHSYRGTFLGGGRGRDRRLLLLTAGALCAAIAPPAFVVALAAVALLSWWIVVVRLRRSWSLEGPDARYVGVRALALDFDGTIADSMAFLSGSAVRTLVEDLGFEPDDAMRGYLATAGADFRTQLEELAPGRASLGRVADRFEAEQGRWMQRCEPFPDVLPAVDDLVAEGIQVLVCSSTRSSLVRAFCERSGLLGRLTSVDGWAPGRSKSAQLRAGVAAVGMAAGDVIFVGDSRRDADVARAAGTRFVGLVREGHPDVFEGTGCAVVDSITVVADALVRVSRSPVEPSIAG